MTSIQYRGQTYHSEETVAYRHEEKWILADLTINPDGTVRISGLLDDFDKILRIVDLELGDEITFDKARKYSLNPYESGIIPLAKPSKS